MFKIILEFTGIARRTPCGIEYQSVYPMNESLLDVAPWGHLLAKVTLFGLYEVRAAAASSRQEKAESRQPLPPLTLRRTLWQSNLLPPCSLLTHCTTSHARPLCWAVQCHILRRSASGAGADGERVARSGTRSLGHRFN